MNDKKRRIFLIIAIIFLVVIVVGATYAYFQAQGETSKSTDIEISANTVDAFSFELGDAINITIDQFTFAQGSSNAIGSTFAKAMLTANNRTNSATEHYYLYLNITSNTFVYSQDETKPELLFNIYDKNNNEVKPELSGIEYKTVTDGSGNSLSGYDITGVKNVIPIYQNKEISTTSSITEEWKVTLTIVNYDFDQSANSGSAIGAKLMIQKSKLEFALGDLNNDGKINTIDTVALKRYFVGDEFLNEYQLKAADVNNDGSVDDIDLDIMMQHLVHAVSFPYQNSDSYSISYDLDGGVKTGHLRTKYTSDFGFELETSLMYIPTKEGYGFIGWTGSNGTDPEENIRVNSGTTGDLHYKANWALLGDANLDGKINLVDVRAFHKYLNGYSVSNEFRKYVADVNRDGEVDYLDLDNVFRYVSTLGTAVEVPIDYIPDKICNITYDLNGGAFVNDDGDGYEARDKYSEVTSSYELPEPSKDGYTFIGWTGSNGGTPEVKVKINKSLGDLHYIANWQQNS